MLLADAEDAPTPVLGEADASGCAEGTVAGVGFGGCDCL